MHEMGLMGDALELVRRDAILQDIRKVTQISLLVGELSNVLPDALEMAFDIYKSQELEFLSKDAIFKIVLEPAIAECRACGSRYKPEQRIAFCPSCQIPSGNLISGEALRVEFYEGS